jgi:hypothetical protein
MNEENKNLSETEQTFKEHYDMLEQALKIKSNPDLPKEALQIQYMQLAESYEKLLKTSVRISKLGDKAQHKLMKYKELLDTLRNID